MTEVRAEVEKEKAGGNGKAASSAAAPKRNLGRNDPCWCGSGKKYKNCHMASDGKK